MTDTRDNGPDGPENPPADGDGHDALLESVLESISDAFYALDRDWRYVIFNRAAEQYFGVSRDNVIGRSIWDLFPQGRGTAFERCCRRAMDERVTSTFESPSAIRPGRTVELRVAPMSGGGIGVALNDVTERKRAEAALRESEQRLDLAVRAHGVGIFDWHIPSGRVLWSEEEERLFGLEPGTFDGRIESWRDRVASEDFAAIRARTREAIAARRDHLDFRFRIHRPDGQLRHIEGAARILYGPDGGAERMVGTNMDVTDRVAAEQRQRLLINELNHRVKNTLAAVQSIAAQTVRRADTLAEFRDSFEGRLMALSGAHDVLTRHQWDSADLADVVDGVMQPFHPGERLQVSGPPVRLSPGQALAFAMAIHELATNAVKYGAWSGVAGRVRIGWVTEGRPDRPGEVRFTWSEEGGPPVRPPSRQGFGSRLLRQGLVRDLGGAVDLAFAPEGLRCDIRAPLAEVD
ncbi:sensor histidine kinase [Phenylobacterium sp.]|uniref:sensor histidine kinase n=1 Tax=Phenylobacterium sp. TaxID=1871053 RepID=UPI002FE356AE